jgi:hypothetical protein
MIAVHKSGLVVTDRDDHFKKMNHRTGELEDIYDGDAMYVVWNLDSQYDPKVSQVASYLPTLHKWLDLKYTRPNEYRVRKSFSNIKSIQKRVAEFMKVSEPQNLDAIKLAHTK